MSAAGQTCRALFQARVPVARGVLSAEGAAALSRAGLCLALSGGDRERAARLMGGGGGEASALLEEYAASMRGGGARGSAVLEVVRGASSASVRPEVGLMRMHAEAYRLATSRLYAGCPSPEPALAAVCAHAQRRASLSGVEDLTLFAYSEVVLYYSALAGFDLHPISWAPKHYFSPERAMQADPAADLLHLTMEFYLLCLRRAFEHGVVDHSYLFSRRFPFPVPGDPGKVLPPYSLVLPVVNWLSAREPLGPALAAQVSWFVATSIPLTRFCEREKREKYVASLFPTLHAAALREGRWLELGAASEPAMLAGDNCLRAVRTALRVGLGAGGDGIPSVYATGSEGHCLVWDCLVQGFDALAAVMMEASWGDQYFQCAEVRQGFLLIECLREFLDLSDQLVSPLFERRDYARNSESLPSRAAYEAWRAAADCDAVWAIHHSLRERLAYLCSVVSSYYPRTLGIPNSSSLLQFSAFDPQSLWAFHSGFMFVPNALWNPGNLTTYYWSRSRHQMVQVFTSALDEFLREYSRRCRGSGAGDAGPFPRGSAVSEVYLLGGAALSAASALDAGELEAHLSRGEEGIYPVDEVLPQRGRHRGRGRVDRADAQGGAGQDLAVQCLVNPLDEDLAGLLCILVVLADSRIASFSPVVVCDSQRFRAGSLLYLADFAAERGGPSVADLARELPPKPGPDLHAYLYVPHQSLRDHCNVLQDMKDFTARLSAASGPQLAGPIIAPLVSREYAKAHPPFPLPAYAHALDASPSSQFWELSEPLARASEASGCSVHVHLGPSPRACDVVTFYDQTRPGAFVEFNRAGVWGGGREFAAEWSDGPGAAGYPPTPFRVYSRPLRPSQFEALLLSHLSDTLLIVGAPGTGKSTTLSAIIRSLLTHVDAGTRWVAQPGADPAFLGWFAGVALQRGDQGCGAGLFSSAAEAILSPDFSAGNAQVFVTAHSNKAADNLARAALSLDNWGSSVLPLTLRLGSFSGDAGIVSLTPRGHLLQAARDLGVLPRPAEGGEYTYEELISSSFVSDRDLYRSILAEARAKADALRGTGETRGEMGGEMGGAGEGLGGGVSQLDMLDALCALASFRDWTSALISRASLIVGTAAGLAKRVEELGFTEGELGVNYAAGQAALPSTPPPAPRAPPGRTLIVEEASRLPEFDLAALLRLGPDRLIMLGDVLQLPPLIRSDYLAHVARAGASAFHRLLFPGSRVATVVLREQGRAHPRLADVYRGAYAAHLPESFRLAGGLRDMPGVASGGRGEGGAGQGSGQGVGGLGGIEERLEAELGGRLFALDPGEASRPAAGGFGLAALVQRILGCASCGGEGQAVVSPSPFLLPLQEATHVILEACTAGPATSDPEVSRPEAEAALALAAALKACFQAGNGAVGQSDGQYDLSSNSPAPNTPGSRVPSIAVLSLYRRQAEYVSDHPAFHLLTSGLEPPGPPPGAPEWLLARPRPAVALEAATVDEFQGLEADVVILSLVKRSGSAYGNDLRRSLVALSRARRFLFVVGCLNGYDGELWREVSGRAARL